MNQQPSKQTQILLLQLIRKTSLPKLIELEKQRKENTG